MEDEIVNVDFEQPVEVKQDQRKTKKQTRVETVVQENDEPINCLRNEKVVVRFIKKPHPLITDPNHVASGGLIEGGKRIFSLPTLSSGNFKNCLTNNEKKYLEVALGLEPNALSIYNKENNFWESGSGNAEVVLSKEDYYLDLSKPTDYIIYKMLLANSDYICPSLRELQNNPKASYQYVMVNENDEAKLADAEMDITSKCYMLYGKYADDADTLRTVVEMIQNKPIDDNTKIEFLRKQVNTEIKMNPKLFLQIISDQYLDAKVIIKRAAKNGIISKRGMYYYRTEDNSPLCEGNEDPTLENAARFITNPKRNDLYIRIQAKLNPR